MPALQSLYKYYTAYIESRIVYLFAFLVKLTF